MRVVGGGPDRVGDILADFFCVDVERCRNLDVSDVIAAEIHIHQARNGLVGLGFSIIVQALNERAGAVSDPNNSNAYLAGRRSGSVHGIFARSSANS